MASTSSLRNIRVSGGLFTENIILRLRDNPEQFDIGKIESFIDIDKKDERKKIQDEKLAIFEWCKDKWDEISPIFDEWSKEELVLKWLKPFFYQFGYVLEEFKLENEDKDELLHNDFMIDYQSLDNINPYFHFIKINEDFDSKKKNNPQNISYHSICQQFINSISRIKWLFLCNGKVLRILTKYYHTYSKGYLEFDLENIFSNRDIIEFNTLFSFIHSSRFKHYKESEEFPINLFQKESNREGVKIGDSLRNNVKEAIELLGNEFIHQNKFFYTKMHNSEIDINEYFAELLRIIYRMIFIFYAEQREMLPGAGSLYFEELSLSSLRSLAEKPIKGDKNYDLWNRLFLSFDLMRKGNDFLEVPCYNGSLFKDENLSIILENKLKISNDMFLQFIRLLTTSNIDKVKQRINFLEISEEEIGAIYESLLDYKPIIDNNLNFYLIEGTERKSTGSYYTPKELIDILIRTTLQPLVEERIKFAGDKKENKEKVILDLRICDPACGGGTFLLAALDFLGKILAEIRSESNNPSETELREARREILQQCIYAVDMNPLAVELVKISLWLRACVKNKPLNFLDNHIKCGNSLIGFGKQLEISKIPIEAYTAIKGNKQTGISGENLNLQNMARKWIQKESDSKTPSLFPFIYDEKTIISISERFRKISQIKEENSEDIMRKEQAYIEAINQDDFLSLKKIANTWLASFYWSLKGNTLDIFPTFGLINQIRINIRDQKLDELFKKVDIIEKNNLFFNWHIEFPDVFTKEKNGFDCILTNPPWETLDFKEREFFLGTNQEIFDAPTQAIRRELILNLIKKNPEHHKQYVDAWFSMKKMAHFVCTSGLYELSAQGTLNTYALFTERCWKLISPKGYVGIIVPTGIITNYYMQDLFHSFVENNSIISLFDFENRKGIFDIHRMFRFCLLSLGGKNISQEAIPMMFYTHDPVEILEPLSYILSNKEKLLDYYNELEDSSKLIVLQKDDFHLLNPNTATCPTLRYKQDLKILKKIYTKFPIIIEKDFITKEIISNIWEIEFKQGLFNMSSDSSKFKIKEDLEKLLGKYLDFDNYDGFIKINNSIFLPLYEGKMIWFYDFRYNSVIETSGQQGTGNATSIEQYQDFNFSVIPRYWVDKEIIEEAIPLEYKKEWFISFRNITNATNERTFVVSIIPKTAVGHSLPLILTKKSEQEVSLLLANLSSLPFDFIVRQKIGSSTNMTFFFVEQFPIIPFELYSPKISEFIIPKVISLLYTSNEIAAFAKKLGFDKPFKWEEEKRRILKAELDALYFILYGFSIDEIEYVLDTFLVLKKYDMENFGEYLSKRLILEAFNELINKKELFINE